MEKQNNFKENVEKKDQCPYGKNINTCPTYKVVSRFSPPIVANPCEGCIPMQAK